ncbi:MAG: NAD(P)-binding domain-containing protein [Erythrobacter sp.]|nr:NAD(P)-binding domain-containing protein [Erythrobacter sp.]
MVGVGDIAEHFVRGMRRAQDHRRILLFPRNASRAAALAAACNCDIVQDRAQLVKSADIVLLAVRPSQVTDALAGIEYPAGTILLSAVGAVSKSTLRQLVGPEPDIIRIMPVMSIEVGEGSIPMFPRHDAVQKILSCLGMVFPVDSEDQLIPATAATCAHGWFYRFLDVLVEHLTAAGLPGDVARDMVLRNAAGAVKFGLEHPKSDLGDIARAVAKPGTFTHEGLEELETGGLPERLGGAASMIVERLKSLDPLPDGSAQ